MTKIATILLAGTAVFGLVAAANAADMGGPLRGPTVVEPIAEAPGATGWYLRGDVGVVLEGKSGFESIETGADKTIVSDKLSSAPHIGLGIGYQFNDYLRADVTADFFSTRKLRARGTYTGYDSTVQSATNNTTSWEGDFTSALILANVYADLGNYYGLTPYVGVGVGAAYKNLSSVFEQASWTYPAGTVVPPGTVTENYGHLPGSNSWSFAYALHAGASYDLAPNLKLDVGYSFKDLGKLNGGGVPACAGGGCSDEVVNLKRLQMHDIHVGARWMFDAPAPRAPIYGAPVVAKY
jgi:opacity protein-like surface antigen